MQSQYVKAQAERDKLASDLARGQSGLRDLDIQIAQADETVKAAAGRQMEALAASHEVTEKEVHVVLLVFVVLAAFATAIAASLAVYGSFTRFTTNDEPRRSDATPNAVVITPTLENWMERLASRGAPPPCALRA